MKPAFFYGLFMDEALLKSKGFNPTCFEIACLEGFGLRIGERASKRGWRGDWDHSRDGNWRRNG
jgi:hypothetical protein